ncbi:MAG: putative solute-binding protein [Thalassolituus sp.]
MQLREREYYDPDMLALQRKVRCKFEPGHFECANPVE